MDLLKGLATSWLNPGRMKNKPDGFDGPIHWPGLFLGACLGLIIIFILSFGLACLRLLL